MTPSEEPKTLVTIKPCHHMEQAVSALSDGSLTGVALWYTRLHVAGCKQCSQALTAFQGLRTRLSQMHNASDSTVPIALSESKKLSLDEAMEDMEERSPKG